VPAPWQPFFGGGGGAGSTASRQLAFHKSNKEAQQSIGAFPPLKGKELSDRGFERLKLRTKLDEQISPAIRHSAFAPEPRPLLPDSARYPEVLIELRVVSHIPKVKWRGKVNGGALHAPQESTSATCLRHSSRGVTSHVYGMATDRTHCRLAARGPCDSGR